MAVFLAGTKASNCGAFWLGGPDFLIEISSPGERTHDKLPFYASVGVHEALLVNRDPWQLELHRLDEGELRQIAVATVENGVTVTSNTVPLTFRLQISDDRPQIKVAQVADGREQKTWLA